VGSHVGEIPGAETKTAERNGPEMVLQTATFQHLFLSIANL